MKRILLLTCLLIPILLNSCSVEERNRKNQEIQNLLIESIIMNPPRVSNILGGGAGLFSSWVYSGEESISEIQLKVLYLDKNGEILYEENVSIFPSPQEILSEEQVFSYKINTLYINDADSYRLEVGHVEVE